MSHQWVISSNKNKNNSCCDDHHHHHHHHHRRSGPRTVSCHFLCVSVAAFDCKPDAASGVKSSNSSSGPAKQDLADMDHGQKGQMVWPNGLAKWFGQMVWHLVHSWPSFLSPGKSENEAYQFRQREEKQLPTQEKLNSSTGLVSPSFLDLWSQKKIKG